MKDMKIKLRVSDDLQFLDVAAFLLVARDVVGVTELVWDETSSVGHLVDGDVTHIRCEAASVPDGYTDDREGDH